MKNMLGKPVYSKWEFYCKSIFLRKVSGKKLTTILLFLFGIFVLFV